MPRGNGVLSAPKCPHFDVSKASIFDSYLKNYKNAKMIMLLNGLKPSARITLNSKFGVSVKIVMRFCSLYFYFIF